MNLEITSVVISAIALLLSIGSVAYNYHESHIETLIDFQWLYSKPGRSYISILVTNMSSKPSVLTKAICHSTWYEAGELHTFANVLNYSTNMIIQDDKSVAYTDALPLAVPPRSAKAYVFALNAELPKNDLRFSFEVNGKRKNMSFINFPTINGNELATHIASRFNKQ